MKIVDANVLLYATNSSSSHHQSAHRWLTTAFAGTESIGFPWVSLLAFIRLSTNPRLFPSALPVSAAFDLVDSWLAQPSASVAAPTARHAAVMRGLLEQVGSAGNLTTDAHLAALAVEYGAEIVTYDRDFARFAIRIHVPS
jgi:toxin-antitoxin system PIN domain toxin